MILKKKCRTTKENDMMQVIKQTHEEKVKMYQKVSKKKLIEMLIATQDLLELKGMFTQSVEEGF